MTAERLTAADAAALSLSPGALATTGSTSAVADASAASAAAASAPHWMHDLVNFRRRLFLAVVEPVIVTVLGPALEEGGYDADVGSSSKGRTSAAGERGGGGLFGGALFGGAYMDCGHAGHGQPCYYRDDTGEVRFSSPSSSSSYGASSHADSSHRRLGFLPNYIEDVSAFRETSMSFLTLVMLFTIMICLFLVLMSCFYHNQKTSPLFISPRRHRLPKLVPPPLPVDSFFSWVKVCFYLSDEEVIGRIGYDALVFVRFHRLALRCIVKMSVFSFVVLLPLNYTGGGHANASDLKGYVGSLLFTDFLRFTMANVSGGSPRLWVHCFAAYLLTGIVVWELLVEYNAFNNIRHRYLLSREPHLRTVLVSNIPRHLRAPSKIETYFRHVYPDAVKSLSMCQNLIELERLVAKRTRVLSQIEKELLLLCRSEKKKLLGQTKLQTCRRALFTCYLFEKVGLVQSTQERLAKLYSRLESLNDQVEKEMKRRRRVMKKLDKMESEVGRYDIDYILASPFVNEVQGGPTAVSTGAPRNPDGTVRTGYVPPYYNDVGGGGGGAAAAAGGTKGSVVGAGLSTPTGPTQRASAASSSNGSFSNNDVEYFETDPPLEDDDDANQKNSRRAFCRAKAAIRRYTRFITRDTWQGGVPATLSEDDHVHTPSSGSVNMQGHIEDHTNEVCDKAFVVMRTFTASTIAIQSMHSSKPGSMSVSVAPEPRDILWENVYLSKGAKRTRSYIGEALILLIICFYVVPVALVSLLVSESALISSSPRLAQLDQASAFFSTGIAMVQPICLVGIQQLLPPLFMQITKAEGLNSFSEVQMKAFSRYFLFQVLNVFLVTAVAGSIFDTIAIIIENPETAFELLGNALPRMSSFFITYVIMKTFIGLGLELVRIVSLVQSMLRFILFPNSTLRAQRSVQIGMRAIDDPGWFPFHKILAQDMLVVVISIVFAVVAPIVLFPCALFCLFSRIMWTHHHMYVYESCFETGGQFWPKIFRRFVFGLIIAQMTITGQFILKEARHEAYATIALSFLTYVFLRRTRARYDAPSSTLPLEVATIMDISVSQEEEALRRAREADAERNHQGMSQPPHESTKQNNNRVTFSEGGVGQGVGVGVGVGVGIPPGVSRESMDGAATVIGEINPFDQAYLQPALRANPRARPEQPFPPAQLGREDVFLGLNTFGSALGVIGEEEVCDDSATVRLKCFNQQDRTMIDQWWRDQMVQSGEQNLLGILTGEESGTLRIGTPMQMVPGEGGMLV